LAAPIWARYTMTLMGMSVRPDVLSTRNMICALDAVSFTGFSSWSSCMALRPRGVAALSSPSIFAAKFMIIEPCTGWSFGISGKIRWKKGRTTVASAAMTPPFSPTRMSPSQSVSTPVRPSEISKATSAMSNVLATMAVKISVSPKNTSFTIATTKAIRKKPIQMKLRTMRLGQGYGEMRRLSSSTSTGTCSRATSSGVTSPNS